MFLHRDNISGPSADMLRAFAVSRQRVAYQRARFQHMPQLFDNLEAARIFLKTVPLEERTRLRDYVNELELNLKNAVLEPPKQSGLTTGLFPYTDSMTPFCAFLMKSPQADIDRHASTTRSVLIFLPTKTF